jgi:CheY-like chemotaxis protein
VEATPPAAVAAGAGAPVAAPGGHRHLDPETPCRALVVEDDAHSRDVLATLLAQSGCSVVAAADGREGLEACRAGASESDGPPFDIVFSDIRMPRLDGLQMMRLLRADPRTATLPLVAVSASSLEHQRRDFIAQGFDDFVGKPYAFDDIYDMLEQHAGVRLVRESAPKDADAAPAALGEPPGTGPHDRHRRARLEAILAASSRGSPAAVRQALAALEPGDVAAPQRQQLEADLKRYDFDGLEARVRGWISEQPGGTAGADVAASA